jgi:hypothetical protein
LIGPRGLAAQPGSGSGSGSGSGRGDGQASPPSTQDIKALTDRQREVEALRAKIEAQNNPKFVRTLTNVQIELTISDQIGTQTPEKKTVSMIVSSGNWGKIRSAGVVRPANQLEFMVDINVDARPFVSVEGPVQLELTLVYSPPGGANKDTRMEKPTGINQSLTVVLQSGKPMVVSQAADPVSDRKVIVEVKATVLK